MAGKRKRPKSSVTPADQHKLERTDQYAKLVRFAQKIIRKEGRVVRTFEVQKIVRRLKVLEQESSKKRVPSAPETEDGGDKVKKAFDKCRRQISRLEQKLVLAKAFDVDRLVGVCSKRLGLSNLAPLKDEEGDSRRGREEKQSLIEDDSKVGQDNEVDHDNEAILTQLTESFLKHKKLVDAVETLNERITDHRRWILKREEYIFGVAFGGPTDMPSRRKKGKKGKKGVQAKEGSARSDHAGPTALFIGSLAGGDDNEIAGGEGTEGGNHYGPGGYEEPIKKNRPGQRQRKAKAMAIEAKKNGKKYESLNLREKKQKPRRDDDPRGEIERAEPQVSASGLRAGDTVKARDVATMGKDWKDEGKTHPSWAARQASKEKAGISQFAGKKITFD